MKLYKFKSLVNLDHVLDIILNDRLYCANYQDLNDPFEGMFLSFFYPNFSLANMHLPLKPEDRIKIERTIDETVLHSDHCNVCSLTSTMGDVRLWSHYADSHKGVAVELELEENIDILHKINYVEELKGFGMGLLNMTSAIDVLSTKTVHWEYEQEYRIINEDSFFNLSENISKIYVGARVKKEHLELLQKCAPSNIKIIETRINLETLKIEPNI